MVRVINRLIADAALVAVLMFSAAGTVAWPRAWMLLASMVIVRAVGAMAVYRVNPDLLHAQRLPRVPKHPISPCATRC